MNTHSDKYPHEFVDSIRNLLHADADDFFEALQREPFLSIRVNDKMDLDVNDLERVTWCDLGYYLSQRPQFTLDPLFHAGCYYVQEASSMFLWRALSSYVKRDAFVLDTCAAPGGKSTLISSYLSSDGFLVSNEFVAPRAHILSENIQKWGKPNCVVTNNDVSHFERYQNKFDAVCVDAPCSGEGMFRKDADAISEWSLDNVAKCVERQRKILSSAWEALKPGGVLIYSTCTFNRLENEENVEWLLDEFGAEYLKIELDESWGITETERGYRFFPHRVAGEGLFLAVVRKADEPIKHTKTKVAKNKPQQVENLTKWLRDRTNYSTVVMKNFVYAIDKRYYDIVLDMFNNLNVLVAGVVLAEQKGRDFIPHASLAFSSQLNLSEFQSFDVDLKTALTYLRTEIIQLPENYERGFVLISYSGVPLGWVKNIGNRANNLYPSHWRIRMAIPSEIKKISLT